MGDSKTVPTVHFLKTDPIPFMAVARGDKRHEVRVNDRNYKTGDVLALQCFDDKVPYGIWLIRGVGYLSAGGTYGLPDNLCVMTLLDPTPEQEQAYSVASHFRNVRSDPPPTDGPQLMTFTNPQE